MNKVIVCHARYGDYSRAAYLALWKERESIAICAVIDQERKYEAPNPRFAAGNAGGRSCDLRSFLQELVPEVKAEGNKVLLWNEGQMARLVVHLSCDGDVVVSTEDRCGSIGVVVRFTKASPSYTIVEQMYDLMAKENQASPKEDAANSFQNDKQFLVF